MDKEYIDKNEILYQMSMGLIPQSYEWTRAYALARKLIKDAPVEDVEPVRHGYWVDIDSYADHDTPIYACSVCCEQVYDKHIKAHKYCLHCGAKMDEDKNIIANKYPRCRKCVYEATCSRDYDNEGTCRSYRRDPKDGGYYG